MFVWCIVFFHLFLSRICFMLARCQRSFIQRSRIKRQLQNLHKLIWWAVGRGRAGSCLRQQAARGEWVCEAGGHWRCHLLHPVLCTKAATPKLHPKESSLKQIHVSQVCLTFSHCLSRLMVRATSWSPLGEQDSLLSSMLECLEPVLPRMYAVSLDWGLSGPSN